MLIIVNDPLASGFTFYDSYQDWIYDDTHTSSVNASSVLYSLMMDELPVHKQVVVFQLYEYITVANKIDVARCSD